MPDRADESRNGMHLAELFFIGELSDRADRPFDRPFEDETRERVGILVSRQCTLNVEMRRAPLPTLRDDAGDAETGTAWTQRIWQQDAELGRDAGTGLVLKCTGT